jgi:hypothetical protein
MSDLYDRIARALGWSPTAARSISMQSLRDLVGPVSPDLAKELDAAIQSGEYSVGARCGVEDQVEEAEHDDATEEDAADSRRR